MRLASCCWFQLASICRNAIDACSLMQGLSCQRMIFESADSRLWLMDDLDSSIRLNHGFVAGHFLHPGLLATDHEMRASSSMSSSEMGVETRAGWRVCGVSSLSSWTPDQSRHCSNQNRRMSSASTSRVPSRISGAWACSRAVITSGDVDPDIMIHGRSDSGAGAMGFGLDARLPASSVRRLGGWAAGRLGSSIVRRCVAGAGAACPCPR